MKKNTFVKILVTLIALAAVIAGAIAIYKKFFCKSNNTDDFDDAFDDEEPDETTTEVKRGYVSIPLDGTASDESEAADDTVKETL